MQRHRVRTSNVKRLVFWQRGNSLTGRTNDNLQEIEVYMSRQRHRADRQPQRQKRINLSECNI